MYSEIEKNAYLCHRNMKEIKNIAFDFGGVVVALSLKGAIKAFEKIGVKDASERLDAFHQKGVFEDLEAGRITMEEFRALRDRIKNEAYLYFRNTLTTLNSPQLSTLNTKL